MKRSLSFSRTSFAYFALAACGLLAILPSRSQHQLADSMGFITNIHAGMNLFHPHHILFPPAVYGILSLLKATGGTTNAMLAGQIHNALWAVVGLLALCVLLRRVSGTLALGLGGALALLLTAGYWTYASLVEPYVPAMACALCLLPLALDWEAGPLTPARKLAFVFFFTMMIAYQQPNVLFCFPLALYVLLLRKREPLRELFQLAGLGGFLLLALYAAVYLKYFNTAGKVPSFSGFARYCLAYAMASNKAWGTMRHFSLTGIRDLLFSQAVNLFQVEKRLDRKSLCALLAGLSILALTLWNGVQFYRKANACRIRAFMLAWLAVYYLFYLWWLPEEKEFLIITLAPLLILGALGIMDLLNTPASFLPGMRIAAWAGGIPFLFIMGQYNYKNWIRPNHVAVANADEYYREALRLRQLAGQNAAILTNFVTRGYLETGNQGQGPRVLDIGAAYDKITAFGQTPDWFYLGLIPQYIFPLDALHWNEPGNPARLKEYYARLLGWQFKPDGQLKSYRNFEVIECDDNYYIKILPERLPAQGSEEYAEKLNEACCEPETVTASPSP